MYNSQYRVDGLSVRVQRHNGHVRLLTSSQSLMELLLPRGQPSGSPRKDMNSRDSVLHLCWSEGGEKKKTQNPRLNVQWETCSRNTSFRCSVGQSQEIAVLKRDLVPQQPMKARTGPLKRWSDMIARQPIVLFTAWNMKYCRRGLEEKMMWWKVL